MFPPSKYFIMTSISFVCSILKGAAISAAFAAIARETLDAVNDRNFERTKALAIVFAGLGVGILVASVLQVGLFGLTSQRKIEAVRARFFRTLLMHKSVAWFDSVSANQLISEANEHTDALRRADETFPTYVQNVSCFFAGIAIGLDFNVRMTLVMSAFAVGFVAFGGFVANLAATNGGQTDPSARTEAAAVVRATAAEMKTVMALTLQRSRAYEYDAATKKDARAAMVHGRRLGVGFGTFHLFLFSSLAATFAYGSTLILESRTAAALKRPPPSADDAVPTLPLSFACAPNAIVPNECASKMNATVTGIFETNASVCMCPACRCGCGLDSEDCTDGGDVMAVFLGMFLGCTALGQSSHAIATKIRGNRAARFFRDFSRDVDAGDERQKNSSNEKYARVDNDDPEIGLVEETYDDGVVLDRPKGRVEFRNVFFSYPSRPEVKVLKNVSFVVESGEKVALVGPRGSGKSTIAALLEKFYCIEPPGGVLFDGIDLSQIKTSQVRSLVGFVFRDPMMFDASIEENVRFGKPGATDREVERALKRANALEFAKAYGKNFNVLSLSLGQRQRVAVARALVRDPSVFILDEATADLDDESERSITDVVKKFDKTTIVIATRVSAARHCTRIVVLEEGMITENGPPSALAHVKTGTWRKMIETATDSYVSAKSDRTDETNALPATETENDAQEAADDDDFIMPDDPSSRAPLSSPSAPSTQRPWSIARYVARDAPLMGVGVIAAAVNGAAFPAFGYMLSHGIAGLFLTNDSEMRAEARRYSIAFVVLAFVNGTFVLLEHWVFGYLSGRLTMRVRADLFRHVLRMDYAAFLDSNVERVLNVDTVHVKSYVLDRLQTLVACTSAAIGGAAVGFTGSDKMAAAALLLFPLVAAAVVIQMRLTAPPRDSPTKKTLAETIHGIRTVAALGMQSSVVDVYVKQLAEERNGLRGFAVGFGSGVMELTQYLMYAVSFYYGAYLIATGEINATQLMQGLTGILLTALGVGQTMALAPDFFRSAGSLERIAAVFNTKSSSAGKKYVPLEGSFKGRIVFESVSFMYPRSSDCALRNLSFAIEPLKTTAFIGDVHSGKAAIAELLLRLYDPSAGNVRLDDLNLKQYDLQWYRRQIGYVSSEPVLFDCTVRLNVSGADSSEEDTLAALKAADAFDFVSKLPDGLETRCAPSVLNKNQKRRLALARAVARHPRIFIFDESDARRPDEDEDKTDEAKEANVQETMSLVSRNRTTIVIARRHSTIRSASIVIELCRGRITRTGTYEEVCLTL